MDEQKSHPVVFMNGWRGNVTWKKEGDTVILQGSMHGPGYPTAFILPEGCRPAADTGNDMICVEPSGAVRAIRGGGLPRSVFSVAWSFEASN